MRRRETLIIWQKQISITERQIMKKTKPKMEVVYLPTYLQYDSCNKLDRNSLNVAKKHHNLS